MLPLETRNDSGCLSVDHNRITLAVSPMLKQFQLPLIFDHRSSQQQVFDSLLLPLLEDLFGGYSCAFLCCGQNASGKTYTIEGGDSQEAKGMIGRLVDYMALKLEAENRINTAYLLRVSYVEVCQEEIIDLLEVRRGK